MLTGWFGQGSRYRNSPRDDRGELQAADQNIRRLGVKNDRYFFLKKLYSIVNSQ